MASLTSSVPQGTVTEFIQRFGRFGGSEELIRRLNGDDELMRIWTEELVERVESSARLFTTPADQLTQIQQWNKDNNWGFTEKHFSALGAPPELPANAGKLVTVVLVPYLGNKNGVLGFLRTFNELWKLAAAQQENSWRWEGYDNPDNLRLLEGIKHPGKKLRWEIIDLGANWDKKNGIAPKDVRNPETSPHAAILAAAALHPDWPRAMDGKEVPYAWIPGYQVSVPGDVPWQDVPHFYWLRGDHEVRLGYGWDGSRYYSWAVPAFSRE